MDKNIKSILGKLPVPAQRSFDQYTVTEIRLRAGCDICFTTAEGIVTVSNSLVTQEDVESLFMFLCDYTVSAYQNQISQGYITLSGGHRIGIGGIYHTDGYKYLEKVTSLNIRINQNKIIDISKDILSFRKGLLICGPPHSGKTTFLKNIALKLKGNVVICDERKEMFRRNTYCDYISGIKKDKAIVHATRSLNPDTVICDEIGDEEESKRILSAVNTGVKFICSVHSSDLDSLSHKPNIKILLDADIFDIIVLLAYENGNFFIKEIRYV